MAILGLKTDKKKKSATTGIGILGGIGNEPDPVVDLPIGTPGFLRVKEDPNIGPPDTTLADLQKKIAANAEKLLSGQRQIEGREAASLRARKARGGAYSLLGSMDRLG